VLPRCDSLPLPARGKTPYNGPVTETATEQSPPQSYSLANLRSLLAIRGIALLGQTAVLAYVVYSSRTTANLWPVAACLIALASLTSASLWRTTQAWPVSDAEFLVQLLLDIAGWTVLMYFTGGANNPFISYYIVPLVISAAVLPWRYTWLIAVLSAAAYSLLLLYYRDFSLFTPHAGMHHGEGSNIHILGMWFNFLFSAGLITYFVVRMGSQLREQANKEGRRREERLRNEQIMAVASLAAGTAHELGTPLSTMTVLVDEMNADPTLPADLRADCELLKQQLLQCRATLSSLSETAETTTPGQSQMAPLATFVSQTLQQWAVRRPGIRYELLCPQGEPGPLIRYDLTLPQALENLLNNGADSGSQQLQVTLAWRAGQASIAVRDWGTGISSSVLRERGKSVIRADRNGLGIGLMLSHATVERHGGRIELHSEADGGTLATLYLPLAGKDTA
jgi:two-component system, sensor histidine kinase RegB